jgi:hypothetical protein
MSLSRFYMLFIDLFYFFARTSLILDANLIAVTLCLKASEEGLTEQHRIILDSAPNML